MNKYLIYILSVIAFILLFASVWEIVTEKITIFYILVFIESIGFLLLADKYLKLQKKK